MHLCMDVWYHIFKVFTIKIVTTLLFYMGRAFICGKDILPFIKSSKLWDKKIMQKLVQGHFSTDT